MRCSIGDKVVHIDRDGKTLRRGEAVEVLNIVEGPDRQYCDLRSVDGVVRKCVSASRLRAATPEETVHAGWPGRVAAETNFVSVCDPLGEVIHWGRNEWVENPDVVATIVRLIRVNFKQGSIGVRQAIGKVRSDSVTVMDDVKPRTDRQVLEEMLRKADIPYGPCLYTADPCLTVVRNDAHNHDVEETGGSFSGFMVVFRFEHDPDGRLVRIFARE